MAVTKEFIGICSDMDTLCEWLADKLIPDYADTVTVEDGSSENQRVITVEKDGNTLCKFTGNTTNYYEGVSVRGYFSSNVSVSVSLSDSRASSTASAITGYICKSAVVLEYKYTQTQANPDGAIAFTKDTQGNTVIITPNGSFCNATHYDMTASNSKCLKPYVFRFDESIVAAQSSFVISLAQNNDVTVLVPFFVRTTDGTAEYTPNAFYTTIFQYTPVGVLSLNDKEYLSFGSWLFADE